jgi:hypothetical protein
MVALDDAEQATPSSAKTLRGLRGPAAHPSGWESPSTTSWVRWCWTRSAGTSGAQPGYHGCSWVRYCPSARRQACAAAALDSTGTSRCPVSCTWCGVRRYGAHTGYSTTVTPAASPASRAARPAARWSASGSWLHGASSTSPGCSVRSSSRATSTSCTSSVPSAQRAVSRVSAPSSARAERHSASRSTPMSTTSTSRPARQFSPAVRVMATTAPTCPAISRPAPRVSSSGWAETTSTRAAPASGSGRASMRASRSCQARSGTGPGGRVCTVSVGGAFAGATTP